MDLETLKMLRAQLVELQDELLGRGRFVADPTVNDDGKRDDDAQPLNEMHQSIASTRNKNRTELLEQIEEALELIDHEPDEYGICQTCEAHIPLGRLKLRPYATLCVACQSAEEGPRGRGRKNLTDFIK